MQVDEDGDIDYVQELQGDSVGDVLSYVEETFMEAVNTHGLPWNVLKKSVFKKP